MGMGGTGMEEGSVPLVQVPGYVLGRAVLDPRQE